MLTFTEFLCFQSINGVYINNERLKSGVAQILHDDDVVQIGVSLKPGAQAPYLYKYKEKMKVKKRRRIAISQEEVDQGPSANHRQDELCVNHDEAGQERAGE